MTEGRGFVVRALEGGDAADFLALRRQALVDHPSAFGASPEDDSLQTEEDVRARLARREDGVVFGAFSNRLAGCAGLFRETKAKSRHKAHLWTMFVAPESRGLGMGRALLRAVVDHAGVMEGVTDIHLGVSDRAVGARALYEGFGFVTWGVEPRALQTQGVDVSVRHMAMLRKRAGGGA